MTGILAAVAASIGGRNYIVSVNNATITDILSTKAEYNVNSIGTVTIETQTDGTSTYESWIAPLAAVSEGFHVQATLNSGTCSTGSFGSWRALTSNRTWETGAGNTCNITIEISDDGGSTTLDSATIVLDAT